MQTETEIETVIEIKIILNCKTLTETKIIFAMEIQLKLKFLSRKNNLN